jgi:hypothetical protein
MRINPYAVTINSAFNVPSTTILNNATSIYVTLNVSGPSTLNNTTLVSSLNVSGTTTLNNTTTLSTLNISGRTIIGSDFTQ